MDLHLEPELRQRKRGGWLATSPRKSGLRIAAIAATEQEAREQFAAIVESWQKARIAELAAKQATN